MTKRALVSSGGGPVGIAWETGLIAGLYDGGVDVGRADLVIGTSAGSAAGALLVITSAPLVAGYDRVLIAPIRIAGDDETAFPRAAAAQLDAGMREGRDAVGELTGLWH